MFIGYIFLLQFTDKGHIFVTVHLVEEVTETEVERDSASSLSGLPVVDRRRSWAGFRIFNQDSSTTSSSPSSTDQINIIVSVEDTGQGIPVEAQSRVFNPFMQVGPSITRTHGGTGIGLSISKCLVHLMKGEIGLASLPQIGSTFTFTAVFSNGSSNLNGQKSEQVNDQSICSDFQGMRALLVDPKPVRAKVSKYHIERLGIQIEVVPDLSLGFSSLNPRKNPLNMVFIEEEIWDKNSDMNNLGKIVPKMFLLSNSTASSRLGFSASGFVITKPLRASMLAASLQRAMGVRSRGDYRNGELHALSLRSLLRGRQILVVDDNPVNLRVAAGALKKYGADVVHAERGKDAITLLTPPHNFDACFMDIQMPEMDG